MAVVTQKKKDLICLKDKLDKNRRKVGLKIK